MEVRLKSALALADFIKLLHCAFESISCIRSHSRFLLKHMNGRKLAHNQQHHDMADNHDAHHTDWYLQAIPDSN